MRVDERRRQEAAIGVELAVIARADAPARRDLVDPGALDEHVDGLGIRAGRGMDARVANDQAHALCTTTSTRA
jgi:hypothetical protein